MEDQALGRALIHCQSIRTALLKSQYLQLLEEAPEECTRLSISLPLELPRLISTHRSRRDPQMASPASVQHPESEEQPNNSLYAARRAPVLDGLANWPSVYHLAFEDLPFPPATIDAFMELVSHAYSFELPINVASGTVPSDTDKRLYKEYFGVDVDREVAELMGLANEISPTLKYEMYRKRAKNTTLTALTALEELTATLSLSSDARQEVKNEASAEGESPLAIFLQNEGLERAQMLVLPTTTVDELCENFRVRRFVSQEKQLRIFRNGRQLRGELTVGGLGIQRGDTLVVEVDWYSGF